MARLTNRQNVLVEFITKQKELDINQNMRMFESLINHYFQKDDSFRNPGNLPVTLKEKMIFLRLMALNFQDLPINLKPLYQQLDGQLAAAKDKAELREIGREVARRQAYRLTARNGADYGDKEAKEGGPISDPSLPAEILVDKITNDYITVRILFEGRTVGPFRLTYFDMPLVDNTRVGPLRLSLLLLNSDEQAKKATVRVIAFDYYLAMDRFDVKDMTVPLGLETGPGKGN